MNGPHAARRGISPLPMRQYTKTTLSVMRQYGETYDRLCSSIRKVTTTHTAKCGKLQQDMRHSVDNQSHAESYVHIF